MHRKDGMKDKEQWAEGFCAGWRACVGRFYRELRAGQPVADVYARCVDYAHKDLTRWQESGGGEPPAFGRERP